MGVHYINVAYFFAHAFSLPAGGADFSFLPQWAFFAVETVYIVGMCLTLILLVMVVYAQIRLVQVEHEGFHALEEKERALLEPLSKDEAAAAEEVRRNDRWEAIAKLSESAAPNDWRRAILEADIMLFDVLGAQGYPGESVGERLKHANPIQMSSLQAAWDAHKLRNQIAHGGEQFNLTERDVRTAVNNYRRVFEEFGAL